MFQKTNFLMLAFAILTVVAFAIGTNLNTFNSFKVPSNAYAAGTKEAFDYLSSSTSSYCGLVPQTVDGYSDDQNIQGACCGAMDLHRYQEQVDGLKKFSDISQIPEDPYNIPVPLAKELFEYQKTIVLSEDQQKTYDMAMEMSGEGGPCCCRCWRWTAFEGQAKYLITEHDFSAEQVAEVWDLEDGCGGAGHEGGH